MCKASTEPVGPQRCSGDTRSAYGAAEAAVTQLQSRETLLMAPPAPLEWKREGKWYCAPHPDGGEYWMSPDSDMYGNYSNLPRLYWVWGEGEDEFIDMGGRPRRPGLGKEFLDEADAKQFAQNDAAGYAQ